MEMQKMLLLSEEDISNVRKLVDEHVTGRSGNLKPGHEWFQKNPTGKLLFFALALVGFGWITRDIPWEWLHSSLACSFVLAVASLLMAQLAEIFNEGRLYLKSPKEQRIESERKKQNAIEIDNQLLHYSPVAIEYVAGACEEEVATIQRRISVLRLNVIAIAGIIAFVLVLAKAMKELCPKIYSLVHIPEIGRQFDLQSTVVFVLALVFGATIVIFPWLDLRCESMTRQSVYLRRILKLQAVSAVENARRLPESVNENVPEIESSVI